MTSLTARTRAWAEGRRLPCTYAERTGSTNDDAKRAGLADPAPERLYLAAHQTAGRGRGANRWLDRGDGAALLSSWSLDLFAPPQAITGPRIGLALYRAARRAWPTLALGLKAPNDLYLDGLKIAGLLIETLSDGTRVRVIVGLGLNVAAHPPSLATATHLGGALGRAARDDEWSTFLDAWLDELRAARAEVTLPTLTPEVRAGLRLALNANVARPYVVNEVTPEGDLVHAAGRVAWTEL